MSEYRKGFKAGATVGWWGGLAWGFIAGAIIAVALFQMSCSPALVIMPPASMQVWTDAPGEPDPLAECRRVGGPCVVATAEAWGYWTVRWSECEIRLQECEEGE